MRQMNRLQLHVGNGFVVQFERGLGGSRMLHLLVRADVEQMEWVVFLMICLMLDDVAIDLHSLVHRWTRGFRMIVGRIVKLLMVVRMMIFLRVGADMHLTVRDHGCSCVMR